MTHLLLLVSVSALVFLLFTNPQIFILLVVVKVFTTWLAMYFSRCMGQ